MATYRRRGKRWYAEVRKRGHKQGKTFGSKTAARVWAEGLEAELEEGQRPATDNTLADAMKRYAETVSVTKSGCRWEQIRLARFGRTMDFAGKRMAEIQPDDIALWRDQRLHEVSPGSVLRELVLLSAVWEAARREWRWIRENPVKDVRKPPSPPAREQTISATQARAIFATAGYKRGRAPANQTQVMAAAFDFALETAMRAGEIRNLRGPDIHLAERFVRLRKTKNGSQRDVPLSSGAVAILKALNRDHPFPITAQNLAQLFSKVRRRAGLEGAFTFHDTRATAITRLSKRLDIHDLARMTGHRDLRMLTRYYRATAAEIAARLD